MTLRTRPSPAQTGGVGAVSLTLLAINDHHVGLDSGRQV